MKKTLVLVLIPLFAIFLFGCEKKSDVTVNTDTANATTNVLPEEVENLKTYPSQGGLDASASTESFIEEIVSIDENFKQNYQIALADAQRALKNNVNFCASEINFYGSKLTPQSEQSFIFYSDEFSLDYYWVVNLNGYRENKKIRSFTARKDLSTDIKCVASATEPTTFSSAYKNFISTDKFKMIDPGIIARTNIHSIDAGWAITVTDNAGAVAAYETINPSQTQATVSSSPVSTQSN